MPGMPIKCGGGPQKIMHLCVSELVNAGGKNWQDKYGCNVKYMFAPPAIFGIPYYAETLKTLATERGVMLSPGTNLVRVDHVKKEATFLKKDQEEVHVYDLLHVVPPHSPPEFIRDSPLADSSGWLDVDKGSCRHARYDNVWVVGDCGNFPTVKTATAAIKQAPIVAHYLTQYITQSKTISIPDYDG